MKKLLFLSIVVTAFISCAKKKECLSQESDEVWLILEDSSGVNLLNTLYQDRPSIAKQGPTASLSHFERVIANNGNENQMAWKIDLNNITSNAEYLIFTESDTFLFELNWSPEDPECDYKDYNGRKLNWLNFEDTTFYSPGVLTYIVL